MLQEFYRGDYRLDKNGRHLKSYYSDDKNVKRVFCFFFMPLEVPHNIPNKKLSKKDILYYFLPEGICFSEGLALFYTHNMKLQFPSGEQIGLYFIIAPIMRMTKENY